VDTEVDTGGEVAMPRDDGKLRCEIRKGSERFMIEVLEDGTVKATPRRSGAIPQSFVHHVMDHCAG
jgi:hypothetical protein